MKIIINLLSRITMYQSILHLLRILLVVAMVLSFFGVLPYTWWHLLGDLTLFIVFCLVSNYALAKFFNVKPNYESQYITAEILTLIVGPLNPLTGWLTIFLISFLAMASKYLLAYGKRHIFNPAGFGVLASALIIGQSASWWIGSRYMLAFVLIGGLLLIQKLRYFHLYLSFLFTYFVALILTLFLQGADNSTIWLSVRASAVDSALLFFAAIMLVEPLTAPKGQRLRSIYGVLVALFIVLHQTYWPATWPTYGLGFETGLLLGNIFAFLISPNSQRQTLKLAEKKLEAHGTYSFWFEPYKKFDYIPGQYLEWTLAHNKHDSRGIRRFFTISSSPTEPRLRLITRMAEKSSTFKQTLLKMEPGDEIVISSLQGEFLLPKDQNQKLAFVAGGVGIAPFLSMTKYLLDKNEKRNAVLFFANKTEAETAFKNQLNEAQKAGVKTVYLLNDPPAGWNGRTGFLTPEIIKEEMPDWKERTFYISGPEPMVLNYEDMLAKMGVPRKQVIRDYFPGYQA
jgi:ferredoxin-NADP reductase/Na+-translocating ferredoxin:NAD+ oxidoreductase RnfD subunit